MSSDNARRRFLKTSMGASALAFTGSVLGGCASASSPTSSESFTPSTSASSRSRYARKGTYINYNENPLGPCDAARQAMADIIGQSGYYRFDLIHELQHQVAKVMKLSADQIQLYPGSGWALTFAPQAFIPQGKSLVTADPGYEQCEMQAETMGAPVHKVPLLPNGAHDIDKMCSYPDAGLIYICNPNNPTGTITPRQAIISALEKKPKDAIVLVDEAYIHFSDEQTVSDLVNTHADLIVTRTFSKLYGMAGLRCGFAMAQAHTLKLLTAQGADIIPVTAAVAALESLQQTGLVPQRRAYTAKVRTDTIDWLQKRGIRCTDSHSNCFMMHTGKLGKDVAAAMAKLNVYVGRAWPSWPDWVRVTVGSKEDMEAFKKAFAQVQTQEHLPNAEEQSADLMLRQRLCTAASLA